MKFKLDEYSFTKEWRYVVPPANTTHIVITQRQDSHFRGDSEERGHFYVSIEDYLRGENRWEHRTGSAQGGFRSFTQAKLIAQTTMDQLTDGTSKNGGSS